MKKLIALLLLPLSVSATTINFDGKFVSASSAEGVTNPVQVNDRLIGYFTDTPTIFSSITSGPHTLTSDAMAFEFYDNFQITEQVIREHGFEGYFDASAIGEWDIFTLTSTTDDGVTYSLFRAYDKELYDYYYDTKPAVEAPFKFQGMEITSELFHGAADLTPVPIPAIGALFGFGVLLTIAHKKFN